MINIRNISLFGGLFAIVVIALGAPKAITTIANSPPKRDIFLIFIILIPLDL